MAATSSHQVSKQLYESAWPEAVCLRGACLAHGGLLGHRQDLWARLIRLIVLSPACTDGHCSVPPESRTSQANPHASGSMLGCAMVETLPGLLNFISFKIGMPRCAHRRQH